MHGVSRRTAVPAEIQRALVLTLALWLLPALVATVTFNSWNRLPDATHVAGVAAVVLTGTSLLVTALPYWRLAKRSERARIVLVAFYALGVALMLSAWLPFAVYVGIVGLLGPVGTWSGLVAVIAAALAPGVYAAVMAWCAALLVTPAVRAFTVTHSRPRAKPLARVDAPPVTLHATAVAGAIAAGAPAVWFRSTGFVVLGVLYASLLALTYRRSEIARRCLLLVSGVVATGLVLVIGIASILEPPAIAGLAPLDLVRIGIALAVLGCHVLVPVGLVLAPTRGFTAGVPPAGDGA